MDEMETKAVIMLKCLTQQKPITDILSSVNIAICFEMIVSSSTETEFHVKPE